MSAPKNPDAAARKNELRELKPYLPYHYGQELRIKFPDADLDYDRLAQFVAGRGDYPEGLSYLKLIKKKTPVVRAPRAPYGSRRQQLRQS